MVFRGSLACLRDEICTVPLDDHHLIQDKAETMIQVCGICIQIQIINRTVGWDSRNEEKQVRLLHATELV